MKVFKNQKLQTIAGLLVLVGLSSCSRGYGCPYDFSVTDSFNVIYQMANQVLIFLF